MGRCVIVAYRPKAGMQQQLERVVAKHVDVLRQQGLVAEKPAYLMRAADGTIVEVFEWLSSRAIEEAHANPAVRALWSEFDAACDYVPIGALPEAGNLFSEFEGLSLGAG